MSASQLSSEVALQLVVPAPGQELPPILNLLRDAASSAQLLRKELLSLRLAKHAADQEALARQQAQDEQDAIPTLDATQSNAERDMAAEGFQKQLPGNEWEQDTGEQQVSPKAPPDEILATLLSSMRTRAAEAPHTPLAKVLERRLTTDMESQPDPSAKGKNKVEPEELAAAVDALLGQLEAAHLSTMGTGATGAVPASTAKAVQPAPGMAVHAHAGITKQTNSNAYKGFAGKGGAAGTTASECAVLLGSPLTTAEHQDAAWAVRAQSRSSVTPTGGLSDRSSLPSHLAARAHEGHASPTSKERAAPAGEDLSAILKKGPPQTGKVAPRAIAKAAPKVKAAAPALTPPPAPPITKLDILVKLQQVNQVFRSRHPTQDSDSAGASRRATGTKHGGRQDNHLHSAPAVHLLGLGQSPRSQPQPFLKPAQPKGQAYQQLLQQQRGSQGPSRPNAHPRAPHGPPARILRTAPLSPDRLPHTSRHQGMDAAGPHGMGTLVPQLQPREEGAHRNANLGQEPDHHLIGGFVIVSRRATGQDGRATALPATAAVSVAELVPAAPTAPASGPGASIGAGSVSLAPALMPHTLLDGPVRLPSIAGYASSGGALAGAMRPDGEARRTTLLDSAGGADGLNMDMVLGGGLPAACALASPAMPRALEVQVGLAARLAPPPAPAQAAAGKKVSLGALGPAGIMQDGSSPARLRYQAAQAIAAHNPASLTLGAEPFGTGLARGLPAGHRAVPVKRLGFVVDPTPLSPKHGRVAKPRGMGSIRPRAFSAGRGAGSALGQGGGARSRSQPRTASADGRGAGAMAGGATKWGGIIASAGAGGAAGPTGTRTRRVAGTAGERARVARARTLPSRAAGLSRKAAAMLAADAALILKTPAPGRRSRSAPHARSKAGAPPPPAAPPAATGPGTRVGAVNPWEGQAAAAGTAASPLEPSPWMAHALSQPKAGQWYTQSLGNSSSGSSPWRKQQGAGTRAACGHGTRRTAALDQQPAAASRRGTASTVHSREASMGALSTAGTLRSRPSDLLPERPSGGSRLGDGTGTNLQGASGHQVTGQALSFTGTRQAAQAEEARLVGGRAPPHVPSLMGTLLPPESPPHAYSTYAATAFSPDGRAANSSPMSSIGTSSPGTAGRPYQTGGSPATAPRMHHYNIMASPEVGQVAVGGATGMLSPPRPFPGMQSLEAAAAAHAHATVHAHHAHAHGQAAVGAPANSCSPSPGTRMRGYASAAAALVSGATVAGGSHVTTTLHARAGVPAFPGASAGDMPLASGTGAAPAPAALHSTPVRPTKAPAGPPGSGGPGAGPAPRRPDGTRSGTAGGIPQEAESAASEVAAIMKKGPAAGPMNGSFVGLSPDEILRRTLRRDGPAPRASPVKPHSATVGLPPHLAGYKGPGGAASYAAAAAAASNSPGGTSPKVPRYAAATAASVAKVSPQANLAIILAKGSPSARAMNSASKGSADRGHTKGQSGGNASPRGSSGARGGAPAAATPTKHTPGRAGAAGAGLDGFQGAADAECVATVGTASAGGAAKSSRSGRVTMTTCVSSSVNTPRTEALTSPQGPQRPPLSARSVTLTHAGPSDSVVPSAASDRQGCSAKANRDEGRSEPPHHSSSGVPLGVDSAPPGAAAAREPGSLSMAVMRAASLSSSQQGVAVRLIAAVAAATAAAHGAGSPRHQRSLSLGAQLLRSVQLEVAQQAEIQRAAALASAEVPGSAVAPQTPRDAPGSGITALPGVAPPALSPSQQDGQAAGFKDPGPAGQAVQGGSAAESVGAKAAGQAPMLRSHMDSGMRAHVISVPRGTSPAALLDLLSPSLTVRQALAMLQSGVPASVVPVLPGTGPAGGSDRRGSAEGIDSRRKEGAAVAERTGSGFLSCACLPLRWPFGGAQGLGSKPSRGRSRQALLVVETRRGHVHVSHVQPGSIGAPAPCEVLSFSAVAGGQGIGWGSAELASVTLQCMDSAPGSAPAPADAGAPSVTVMRTLLVRPSSAPDFALLVLGLGVAMSQRLSALEGASHLDEGMLLRDLVWKA